jgi:hypothetical protein
MMSYRRHVSVTSASATLADGRGARAPRSPRPAALRATSGRAPWSAWLVAALAAALAACGSSRGAPAVRTRDAGGGAADSATPTDPPCADLDGDGACDPDAGFPDEDGDGIPDHLDPDYPRGRDAGGPVDPGVADGGGVYEVDAGDGGAIVADLCPASAIVPTGCTGPLASESLAARCNGLDDDCDGEVDEGCACTPGEVQRCFRGPPGRRGVGACQDGTQRCLSAGEFGLWGPCEGGIAPSAEACDDLDNDCNGCTDEIEGCVPTGSCPGPGDPRVPDGRPFSTYDLRGGDFYTGTDAASWRWTVSGTPCDRMFLAIPGSTATAENGQLSFRLTGATSRDARLEFKLSGDYTVTLTVTRTDGTTFTCTWIVHVRAPGVRVELCWDATGPTASMFGGTVDVDLHLGKHGRTPRWFDALDCDYLSCRTTRTSGASFWGYADSPPGSCGTGVARCPNPRLDIDNISTTTEYRPENINVDNPEDGDRFRVMVHHYTTATRLTRPLVNVYCGGELRGTYGAAPDTVPSFDEGGGRGGGDMWRVVDIQAAVSGGVTTDCALTPLTSPGGGYDVRTGDTTF